MIAHGGAIDAASFAFVALSEIHDIHLKICTINRFQRKNGEEKGSICALVQHVDEN